MMAEKVEVKKEKGKVIVLRYRDKELISREEMPEERYNKLKDTINGE